MGICVLYYSKKSLHHYGWGELVFFFFFLWQRETAMKGLGTFGVVILRHLESVTVLLTERTVAALLQPPPHPPQGLILQAFSRLSACLCVHGWHKLSWKGRGDVA